MKTIIITMISIALLAMIGNAQENSSNKSLTTILEKQNGIVVELEKVTKNKPYSAEGISESVQVLQDGNRITKSTSVKMFRDSEGRTRREGSGSTGNFSSFPSGNFGFSFGSVVSNTISIYDPVKAIRYTLNPTTKEARRYDNQNQFGAATLKNSLVLLGKTEGTLFKQAESINADDELNAEKRAEAGRRIVQSQERIAEAQARVVQAQKRIEVIVNGSVINLFYKSTKSESLGTKIIEGVEAEGTRTVKTIEAGAIGNELPIEIVYEKWYSKDLGLVVYSRNYDPRSGEQIYRLTNIDQTEPDSSLFTVPSDYKIVDTKPIGFNNLAKPKNLFENEK